MDIDILVPPLSQTSDTLVLTAWLKRVGDAVAKGEALFEVETDKATLEVEAPASGVLREVLAAPGTEVAVRSVIGTIAAAGAKPAATPTNGDPQRLPVSPHSHTPTLTSAPTRSHAPTPSRLFASPRARRLADREGVALDAITATGPRGMIVERDVRAYLEARANLTPPPAASLSRPEEAGARLGEGRGTGQERRVPLSPTRRTIARRLQAARQTTAPVTLAREADATELKALRERLLTEPEVQAARPTYTDFLLLIAARCLLRHPALNATLDGEHLETFESAHIGLAVDTERGLLVPVLRHVERLGLLGLARERTALAQRAREGKLTPDELAGGTFSLSNLGPQGIDAFTPLLNPPQVAILGLGRLRAAARPIGEQVTIRQTMWLSLTFDHRAVDGAPAARFLADVAEHVERPDRLWL